MHTRISRQAAEVNAEGASLRNCINTGCASQSRLGRQCGRGSVCAIQRQLLQVGGGGIHPEVVEWEMGVGQFRRPWKPIYWLILILVPQDSKHRGRLVDGIGSRVQGRVMAGSLLGLPLELAVVWGRVVGYAGAALIGWQLKAGPWKRCGQQP